MKNEVFKRAIHAERTSMYKERLRETEKISKSSKLFLVWCSRNKVYKMRSSRR